MTYSEWRVLSQAPLLEQVHFSITKRGATQLRTRKRSAGNGNLVPAISLSTDLPAGMTLQSFFLQQKNMKEQLQTYLPPIED